MLNSKFCNFTKLEQNPKVRHLKTQLLLYQRCQAYTITKINKMKKILLFITLISFAIIQSQIVSIPDTNFKNTLLSASPTVHIAKDLDGNWVTIDLNNDSEIQNSEAENITH